MALTPGASVLATAWPMLRAESRTRWRSWLSLAVLVGVAGAVVLAAAAGARRTSTAFPRLLEDSHAAQVNVSANGDGRGYYDALARLPAVAGLARVLAGENLYLVLPGRGRGPFVNAQVSVDGRFGTSIDRFTILSGRMADPGSANEVVIDPQLAAGYGLRPGATVSLLAVPQGAAGSPDFGRAARLRFLVAGIAVFSNQVVPVTPGDHLPELALTPAFLRSLQRRVFPVAGEEALLRLRPGTDLPRFDRQLNELAQRYPSTQGVVITDLADQQQKVEQAIQPQADALALFAALAGLIVLAVTCQLLGQQLITGSSAYPTLRALGMDRRQLFSLALLRAGLVSLPGGCIAVAMAIAASPLMPIGPARLAEPDPGVEVNLAVLGIGLAAIAALPLLVIAPVAWHIARVGTRRGPGLPESHGPSRLAASLARLGGSPAVTIGARMAFEPGRGHSVVSARSALAATTAAVAAVAAATVFGASLIRLVDTPRLYGQNWTLGLSLGYGAAPASGPQGVASFLSRVPGVAAYAGGNSGQISIDGQQVAAVGIQPLRGEVFPTLIDGRPPASADEIVLGSQTMRRLGKHVGQMVLVQTPAGTHRMRIAGQAIFPSFGVGLLTPTGLGDGAAVIAPLVPPNAIGCARGYTCYDFFLIRFRPGTQRADITAVGSRFVSIMTAAGCPAGTCQALTTAAPAAISNYSRVRATPLILGGLLALLAICLIAQMLISSTPRRRRDLAVLKVLGFLRRQVSATVVWQSTALVAVALLAGLPLGVAGGRWAWDLFAQSAGIQPSAAIPLGSTLLAIPVALALANVIAAGPARRAARIKPSVTLRSD